MWPSVPSMSLSRAGLIRACLPSTTTQIWGATNIFIDWANAHESGDDGYYLQMPITVNKDAALFLCALIARSN